MAFVFRNIKSKWNVSVNFIEQMAIDDPIMTEMFADVTCLMYAPSTRLKWGFTKKREIGTKIMMYIKSNSTGEVISFVD